MVSQKSTSIQHGIPLLAVMALQRSALGLQPPQFIEISNPLKMSSGPPERLPASFVSGWPTWVLAPENDDNDDNDKESMQPLWSKIPDDNGFVQPCSLHELWQPLDLKPPDCRLALGFHVRDGVIRHLMPALDLSYNKFEHRNRGLCTVPRAHQWMDFGAYMAGVGSCQLRLETKKMVTSTEKDGSDDDNAATTDDNAEWSLLAELDSIEEAVERAIAALAEEPPGELGDGSSIVQVLLCSAKELAVVPCPRPGYVIRCQLMEDGEPLGCLNVKVERTAAGCESEYLPETYEPLFSDVRLRRPAYTMTKQRLEQAKRKKEEQ